MDKKITQPAVAILTGGLSKRMGTNKDELTIGREDSKISFLQKISEEFSDFEFRFLSTSEKRPKKIKEFVSINDKFDNLGPIGGIYSVLSKSSAKGVLFVACDMPFYRVDAARYLIGQWDQKSVCIPVIYGKKEPLAGIYTKSVLSEIEKMIEEKNVKLGTLLERVDPQYVDMSMFEDCFVNIDTPEEYESYCKNAIRIPQ